MNPKKMFVGLLALSLLLMLVGSGCPGKCDNHCSNGKQDCGEAGIDCGGECDDCPEAEVDSLFMSISPAASVVEQETFEQNNHGFNWSGAALYHIATTANGDPGYTPHFTCPAYTERIAAQFLEYADSLVKDSLVIRFPGGEVGNYYVNYGVDVPCNTGDAGFGFTPIRSAIHPGGVANQDASEDNNVIYDFIEWVKVMQARNKEIKVLYVVNLVEHMVDANGDALPISLDAPLVDARFEAVRDMNLRNIEFLMENGVQVVGIEFGNELHAGRFGGSTPAGVTGSNELYLLGSLNGQAFSHYKELIVPYLDAIDVRRDQATNHPLRTEWEAMDLSAYIFPQGNGNLPTEWNEELMEIQGDLDGFIIHDYFNEPNANQRLSGLKEFFETGFAAEMEGIYDRVDNQLGAGTIDRNKPIWLTEWGPRTDLPDVGINVTDPKNHQNDLYSTAFAFLMQLCINQPVAGLSVQYSNFQAIAQKNNADTKGLIALNSNGTSFLTNWYYPFWLLKEVEGFSRVEGVTPVFGVDPGDGFISLSFRKLEQENYSLPGNPPVNQSGTFTYFKFPYVNLTENEVFLEVDPSGVLACADDGAVRYYQSPDGLKGDLDIDGNEGAFTLPTVGTAETWPDGLKRIRLPRMSIGVLSTVVPPADLVQSQGYCPQ